MRTEYTTGYCIAAPYQISDGSLPAILTRVSGSDTLTDISLGNLQLTPDTTVAQFSLAVMQSNSLYLPGDSLLYLDALQSADPATGVSLVSAHLYKVTLDPADRTPLRLDTHPSHPRRAPSQSPTPHRPQLPLPALQQRHRPRPCPPLLRRPPRTRLTKGVSWGGFKVLSH